MFKKITVAIDGSDASANALRVACDLAGKYGSKIHLVHTPQMETTAYAVGAGAMVVTPSQKELDAAGAKIIDDALAIAKECGQKIAKTHLAHGNAADQILHCAEEWGADLIVMGRRGLGSFGSLVLGSTSLRVSHLAECACLTVE
ncbi:MAG: universal stress protein [Rhodobacterales bacterium]